MTATTTATAARIRNGFNRSVSLVFRGFEYVSCACTWHDNPHLHFIINDSRIKAKIVGDDYIIPMKNKRVNYDTFENFIRASGINITRVWDDNEAVTTIG